MIGFIYFLKNPKNNEIFYVGCTVSSIQSRLKSHFDTLKEYRSKNWRLTPTLRYFEELEPEKPTIHLLDIVLEENLYQAEKSYIKIFREQGFRLTNSTIGGKGGNIFEFASEEDRKYYFDKLSKSLKGRQKPEDFSINLSLKRTGLGNPAAGTSKYGWTVGIKDEKYYLFKYPFEINQFLNKKDGWNNAFHVRNHPTRKSYGYKWVSFDSFSEKEKTRILTEYFPL